MFLNTHTCIPTYIHPYIHTFIHTYIHAAYIHTILYIHIPSLEVRMCLCVCVCVCVCVSLGHGHGLEDFICVRVHELCNYNSQLSCIIALWCLCIKIHLAFIIRIIIRMALCFWLWMCLLLSHKSSLFCGTGLCTALSSVSILIFPSPQFCCFNKNLALSSTRSSHSKRQNFWVTAQCQTLC